MQPAYFASKTISLQPALSACRRPTPTCCRAVSRVQARFNAFVRTFKESGTDEEPKYMQLLQEVGASPGRQSRAAH